MKGAAPAAIYSIDNSSLMDWHGRFYPTDVFPSLAERVHDLVTASRLFAAEQVREEVDVVGTTGLREWVAAQKRFVVPNATVLTAALSIKDRFTGLLDPKATYEEADAYVIALAQQHNGIVITQETAAAEKRNPKRTHYIPDVCRELGIPCISFLGLARREGWAF